MSKLNQTFELRRIHGLFRRWEVAHLLVPGEDYHLEDAGTTADGTELIAVYRSVPHDADEAEGTA